MPPQGSGRSAQAQVPFRQSQRRETHSVETEQVAPAGPQAWPAMLKGQVPGSPDIEALASTGAPAPGAPPVGEPPPGEGDPPVEPIEPVMAPPVADGPPQPPTLGGPDPAEPSDDEPSPLP
jgi:hypothetical protein